jgi:hypothetical protein
MKKYPVLLLGLTIIICALGCTVATPRQEPIPTPTAAIQTTIAPTTTMPPIPTARPTSTTQLSRTITPQTARTTTPTFTPSAEPTATSPQTTTLPDGSISLTFGIIDIIGTQKFIDQTSQALSLLKDKSPEAYRKIETYVGLIKLGEHSAMWAFEVPPRYEVGERTADASTAWYASTIAHDATHSELYHEYLIQNGAPVPDDVWASVAAEQFCIAYQLKVLKEVDGSAYEVEYLATQTGTHCDVDNDGDCDWEDYENRDW